MFKVEYETLINGEWYIDHAETEIFASLEEARCAAELRAKGDSEIRCKVWEESLVWIPTD
jgi:hypothetical protein